MNLVEKTDEDISILEITLPLSAANDKKLHGIVQLILDGETWIHWGILIMLHI